MNDYIYYEVIEFGVSHKEYIYRKGDVYKVPRSHLDFQLCSKVKELSPLDVLMLRRRGVRVYDLLEELKRSGIR